MVVFHPKPNNLKRHKNTPAFYPGCFCAEGGNRTLIPCGTRFWVVRVCLFRHFGSRWLRLYPKPNAGLREVTWKSDRSRRDDLKLSPPWIFWSLSANPLSIRSPGHLPCISAARVWCGCSGPFVYSCPHCGRLNYLFPIFNTRPLLLSVSNLVRLGYCGFYPLIRYISVAK